MKKLDWKINLNKKFFIEPDDSIETLQKKKKIEHILFSKSLIKVFN